MTALRTHPYAAASATVHRLQPAVRRWWRAALLARARDVTAATAARSCLVLAPHPDDETLGCGATIARKRAAGTAVTVVIAADGRYSHKASEQVSSTQLRDIRAAEAVSACGALGVDGDALVQLGFEDTRLAEARVELVERLDDLVTRTAADEVLVVSGRDHHPDHQALNRAAHEVLRDHPEVRRVAEYPVWYWMDGPWLELSARSTVGKAAHLLAEPLVTLVGTRPETVVAESFLTQKRAALAAYRSQTTNLTGEPQWPVMDAAMLAPFLEGRELFWPVER